MTANQYLPTNFEPFKLTCFFYKRILLTLNKKREFENSYPILFSKLLKFKENLIDTVEERLVAGCDPKQMLDAKSEVKLFLEKECIIERLLDTLQHGKIKITQEFVFDHIFRNYGIGLSDIQRLVDVTKQEYIAFLQYYDKTFGLYECDVFKVLREYQISTILTQINLKQLYINFLILEQYASYSDNNSIIQKLFLEHGSPYVQYPAFLFTGLNQAFTEINRTADLSEFSLLSLNIPLIEDTSSLAQILSSFLIEFHVHKTSYGMQTAQSQSDILKAAQQGLPIIELLNVLEPILNKNTNAAYAHLGTYKAIRGNLVALLYHDLNKARYAIELEQLRKLEEFESASIIRETTDKAKVEEQLKNLKAINEKKFHELVQPMDRNQFMRDLCELVNSDPNITASTYPANANHVSGLSYSVHRIPQNSESISKDNIFTGIQNYREKFGEAIARFLVT